METQARRADVTKYIALLLAIGLLAAAAVPAGAASTSTTQSYAGGFHQKHEITYNVKANCAPSIYAPRTGYQLIRTTMTWTRSDSQLSGRNSRGHANYAGIGCDGKTLLRQGNFTLVSGTVPLNTPKSVNHNNYPYVATPGRDDHVGSRMIVDVWRGGSKNGELCTIVRASAGFTGRC